MPKLTVSYPNITHGGIEFLEVDPSLPPFPEGATEALVGILVKLLQPKIAVEIGMLYGLTTALMAYNMPPGGVLYGLDLMPDSARPVIDAYGLSDRVVVVGGDSAKTIPTLPDGIEFVYLDGNHGYGAVKADTEALWPKLADGAVVVFDDLNGIRGGVIDWVPERFPGQGVVYIRGDRGFAIVQKPPVHIHMVDEHAEGGRTFLDFLPWTHEQRVGR